VRAGRRRCASARGRLRGQAPRAGWAMAARSGMAHGHVRCERNGVVVVAHRRARAARTRGAGGVSVGGRRSRRDARRAPACAGERLTIRADEGGGVTTRAMAAVRADETHLWFSRARGAGRTLEYAFGGSPMDAW